MSIKAVSGIVAAGLLFAGQAAMADPYGVARGNPHVSHVRYDGGYEWARVVDVDPIIRRVRVSTPSRECWNEERYEQVEHRSEPRGAAGSMILGGIVGAVIGNQIGSGDGRRAATVAGAVIGSAIGHDRAERRDPGYAYTETRPYSVERCKTRYDESYEERIEGYHVTYLYNGRRMTTELPYDPGNRIQVRVDVRPTGR